MSVEYKVNRPVLDPLFLDELSSKFDLSKDKTRILKIILCGEIITAWRMPIGSRNMTACRFQYGNDYHDIIPILGRPTSVAFWMKILDLKHQKTKADKIRTFLCLPQNKHLILSIENCIWESSKLVYFEKDQTKVWSPPGEGLGQDFGVHFVDQSMKFLEKARKIGLSKEVIIERINRELK